MEGQPTFPFVILKETEWSEESRENFHPPFVPSPLRREIFLFNGVQQQSVVALQNKENPPLRGKRGFGILSRDLLSHVGKIKFANYADCENYLCYYFIVTYIKYSHN
jgi:hypothetical protein